MSITVEQGVAIAVTIVDAIVKAAPAIQSGVASTIPYVTALGGIIAGTNATQEQIDELLAKLKADSEDFQTPLPPEE